MAGSDGRCRLGEELIAMLPLTSTLLAWLLLGEHLGGMSLLGAAFLLSAMVMILRATGAAAIDGAAA